MLADGVADAEHGWFEAAEFVTHEFPVERVAEALAAVRQGDVVKCLLRF
jgi:Zn-dependent alcohol dehydrogenase